MAAALLLAHNSHANAATRSRNFNVRINIVKACRISATAMNFGNMSKVLGTETSTSTLNVICSLGTPYSVSLRGGRALSILNVNLTNPAGNIIRTGLTLSATAGTTSGSHILTGKLVANANPALGLYQRTQTVYVNY
jgi:spore coat protein U-like protein